MEGTLDAGSQYQGIERLQEFKCNRVNDVQFFINLIPTEYCAFGEVDNVFIE